MTTAEAAADVQVPKIGEHSPRPVDGVDTAEPSAAPAAEAPAPTTFTFTPNCAEFGPPTGHPATRQQVEYDGPIVVPLTKTIVIEGTERWFFRQLDKLQQQVKAGKAGPLKLSFFWLEHAGVDEQVIERIALLPVEEWQRFYDGWMSGAASSNLGE